MMQSRWFLIVLLAVAVVAGGCSSSQTPIDVAVRDASGDVSADTQRADTGSSVDAAPDVVTTDTGRDSAADASDDIPIDSGAVDSGALDSGALDSSSGDVVSFDALGSACTDNSMCTTREYCAGVGCGTAGTCLNRPVACTNNIAPVCGCDSVTYLNLCHAHIAGVRVASTGVCDGGTFDSGVVDAMATDASDVCTTNADCAATDFCMIPSGNACGSPGTCQPRPTSCPGFCVLECGCTGMNYCNECLANRAGTNIAHAGSCADGGI